MGEDNVIKEYAYYLRMERNNSPNTVAAYTADVSDFFSFLAENSLETSHKNPSTQDIENYLIRFRYFIGQENARIVFAFILLRLADSEGM